VGIEHELEQIERFFLLMARERTTEQGSTARTTIRRGFIHEEIKNAAVEEAATLVVLGCPAGKQSAFQMSTLREFAEEIERQTGAEAVIV
jgi:hypothetical protein